MEIDELGGVVRKALDALGAEISGTSFDANLFGRIPTKLISQIVPQNNKNFFREFALVVKKEKPIAFGLVPVNDRYVSISQTLEGIAVTGVVQEISGKEEILLSVLIATS